MCLENIKIRRVERAMSKILIIEDEESIAELERDYLEISSYEVTICNDGEKGLKAVSYTHLTLPTTSRV